MAKKAAAGEEVILLGRPKNNLKIGIVGMPNVGKSTLFNILTKMTVPAENYPFCTIEPNEARVAVPDPRYDWLVDHYKPASAVPAFLSVTDIAGLVRGASTGQGLGNAFLSHIRGVDGIYHVVRIFDDENITHVEGNIDPVRDMEIIEEELRLKDLEAVTNAVDNLEKELKRVKADKTKKDQLDVQKLVKTLLEEKKVVRFHPWKATEVEAVNDLMLLTAKPVVYLVNMAEEDYLKQRSKWLLKIKEWLDKRGYGEVLIPFSAAIENKLVAMDEAEKKEYLTAQKTRSTIPKIIKVGYEQLSLVHFFTCGTDEVKCWTIRKGTKAPQAAGTIHTDFMAGFICAEVQKFADFKELGNEGAVKAAGKCIQQGKNYVVEDGDICYFKVNSGGGLQQKKKEVIRQ